MERTEEVALQVFGYDNPTLIIDTEFQPLNLDNVENMSEVDIQQKDHRGYSLLMRAAEAGHKTAVEYLICCGENLEFEVEGKTAADLAFANGHHDIVLILVKANAKLPINYKHELASSELQKFVTLSDEMHKTVMNCDENNAEELEGAKKLISRNSEDFPTVRHFYNLKNNSLLCTAILNKMFEIYKFLISLNIFLGDHESPNSIMKSLSVNQQRKLRIINEELSTNIFTDEMMTLMRNCKLGPGVTNHGQYIEFIRKSFDFLFQIPSLATILKVVAARREFKIIFDFKRESLEFLVPSAEPYTNGLFYPAGKIYIAAKDMLDPSKFVTVYSVIIHELCHFAMFLVYNNEGKPYREKDSKTQGHFIKIVEECERVCSTEEIVSLVYEAYPEEMYEAELIVRIPQMIVAFFNNQRYLNSMRETFSKLFEFFEMNIVSEMEREIPNLEKKFGRNKEVEKFKRLNYILITFIVLAIPIVIGVSIWLFPRTYSWSTLEESERNQFYNAKLKFYDVDVVFQDIFPNGSEIYDSLLSEHIEYGLDGDIMGLSKAVNQFYKQNFTLDYQSLPKNLKENFVTRFFNFQGQPVEIQSILTNFEVLNELNSSQVLDTYENSLVKISKPVEVKTNFFIERFFIDEEIEINRLKHYVDNEINKQNVDVKSFDKILAEVMESRIFILSSLAGEGKSTTFRNIARVLKQKFPKKWIQFVDLKMHFEAYKSGVKTNLKNSKELSTFFTHELLKLNNLEAEIFRNRFEQNEVIFLWDGIDEIAPIYGGFMLDLTSTINRNSECIQFISTRPQFSKDFRVKFWIIAHKLMPIGKSSRFEFLVKNIASKNHKGNVDEFWGNFTELSSGNFEKYLSSNFSKRTENEKFYSSLLRALKVIESIDKSTENEDFITNPLLLRMISEVLEDDFEVSSNLNLFLIFDAFLHKKLEIASKKGAEVVKDVNHLSLYGQILAVHQAFALKHIFENSLIFNLKLNISDLEIFKSTMMSLDQKIIRIGILHIYSSSDFTFVHQTFAEFLVAKYLIDIFERFDVENSKPVDILKIYLLNAVLFSGKFEVIKNFILNYAKIEIKIPNLFESIRDLRDFYPKLASILRDVSWLENFKDLLYSIDSPSDATFNVFNSYISIRAKINEKFVNSLNIENVLLSKNEKGESLLREIIERDDAEKLLEQFLITIQEYLTKDEIFTLLLTKESDNNEILWMLAGKKLKLNTLRVFWDFIEKNLSEEGQRKILISETKNYWTSLQYSTLNKDSRGFSYVTQIYEKFFTVNEIQNIFEKPDFYLADVIRYSTYETASNVAEYLKKIYENEVIKLRKFLSQRDEKSETIFIKFKDSTATKENLQIFNELLRKTFDETQEKEFKKFFDFTVEYLNVFKRSKLDTENIIQGKWNAGDFKYFVYYFEDLQTKFGLESLRKIFNEKNWNFILRYNVYRKIQEFILSFMDKCQRILGTKETAKFITSQRSSNNVTLLMLVASKSSIHDFETFWNFLDTHIDDHEKKKVLMEQQRNSWTALQYSTFNKDQNSFLKILKIYERFFTTNELKENIEKSCESSNSFLLKMIELASFGTIREVLGYLKKLYNNDKKTLFYILSARDTNGVTILSKEKERLHLDIYEIFVDVLKEFFSSSTQSDGTLKVLTWNLKTFRYFPYFNESITFTKDSWSCDDVEFFIHFLNKIQIDLSVETIKEVLLLEDENFNTPLQISSICERSLVFKQFKDVFMKYFSTTEVSEILLKFPNNKLPFIASVIEIGTLEATRELSSFLTEIFIPNSATSKLKELLTHRDENGHTIFSKYKNNVFYKEKLEVFIWLLGKTFTEDQKNEFNKFFLILRTDLRLFQNVSNLESFERIEVNAWSTGDVEYFVENLKEIQERLSDEKLKMFLLFENENFDSAILKSMFSKETYLFRAVKNVYLEIFSKELIKSYFINVDKRKRSFVEDIIRFSSIRNSLEIKNFLKDIFKEDLGTLRKILSHRDEEGSIYKKFKNDEYYKEKLSVFESLLRETFDEEENSLEEFRNALHNLES